MPRVVSIKQGKPGTGKRQNVSGQWWKRRLAAQVMAQLPDDIEEALEVLDETKRLILLPLPKPA